MSKGLRALARVSALAVLVLAISVFANNTQLDAVNGTCSSSSNSVCVTPNNGDPQTINGQCDESGEEQSCITCQDAFNKRCTTPWLNVDEAEEADGGAT